MTHTKIIIINHRNHSTLHHRYDNRIYPHFTQQGRVHPWFMCREVSWKTHQPIQVCLDSTYPQTYLDEQNLCYDQRDLYYTYNHEWKANKICLYNLFTFIGCSFLDHNIQVLKSILEYNIYKCKKINNYMIQQKKTHNQT